MWNTYTDGGRITEIKKNNKTAYRLVLFINLAIRHLQLESHVTSEKYNYYNINNFQTFAHIYFERVLSREITYFDDFVTLVEGLTFAHLPALRKEVE